MNEPKRKAAQEEVESLLWALRAPKYAAKQERTHARKQQLDVLRAELVKDKTACLQLRETNRQLEMKVVKLESKLARWQEFFTSAIAAKRENVELRRKVESYER